MTNQVGNSVVRRALLARSYQPASNGTLPTYPKKVQLIPETGRILQATSKIASINIADARLNERKPPGGLVATGARHESDVGASPSDRCGVEPLGGRLSVIRLRGSDCGWAGREMRRVGRPPYRLNSRALAALWQHWSRCRTCVVPSEGPALSPRAVQQRAPTLLYHAILLRFIVLYY